MTEIEQANLIIQQAEKANRLLSNQDFKDVIIVGFIEDYLLAQTNYANFNDEQRNRVNERIAARGHLYNYLNQTVSAGVQARELLSDSAQEIDEE